ncbi:hypothetical protein GCM10011499_21570 [Pelagibacterium lentulum]|uniref:Uncharacterized protein n=1 Tax=Pelagibacterium lentulum TaxID=2029865 RepID=A0A916VXJ9_9HYPH|nr:hypothetical protein GCM10011499_21570 [Pelagibacterium lentulum]
MYDVMRAPGFFDFLGEDLLRVRAFKDQGAGLPDEQTLDGHEGGASGLALVEMQCPAMWRVERNALAVEQFGKAGIKAALGAVSMQDVNIQGLG